MSKKLNNIDNMSAKQATEEFLKETPEGLQPAEDQIAVATTIPNMRKIRFRNDRDQGMPLEFHYHSKAVPMTRYTLFHGKEYTLPEEVIQHLEDRKMPIYAYRKNADGLPELYVTGYTYHFNCREVRD